jgi:hypothetical protein
MRSTASPKLGEELHFEMVGKHLPFDCSGP